MKSNYSLIFFIIVYALFDVFSSTSAGNSNDHRTLVYVTLFMIMILMTISICIHKYIRIDIIVASIISYILYYAIDMFVIVQNTSWTAISYLALCIWWMLTITYYRNQHTRIKAAYFVNKIFVRFMFAFYLLVVLYSSFNISASFSTVTYARVGYIYHILALMPFLLLEQNGRIKNTCIVLALFAVFFSFKRGAIIVLPLSLIVYYFVQNRTGHANNNLGKLTFAAIIFIVGWFSIDHYSKGYLSGRFSLEELSSGSGRYDLLQYYMDKLTRRSTFQNCFGLPSAGEQIQDVGVHNELVNQLYLCGIIGAVLYIAIMVSLVTVAIRLVRVKSLIAAPFCFMTTYSLSIGIVSGWMFMHSTFYIMMFIGFALAHLRSDNMVLAEILEQKKGDYR